ncbi:nuclear polyadenylated rna-binding protein nab2 [Diplodia corticola]|uniref:Nuclear polyadenylated rna-binding protein nab2 n=1 Tax=Diplodia corticola TaxID=236234 RepID=A0A1J9QSL9_9PEZI|nr:nuclear polyadenylated rna-binding protein nab2 [Diplodia corticola]OJD31401.1 nuclear polyadenylated rna-binding protein nab2 [Diplodia corticola]
MSDCEYDSDEYDLYDDNWLYIAEDDNLADDLAERAVASPPARDYDLDGSGYNSDYFEYWVDIEYNSDGWNDAKGPPKTSLSNKTAPGTKKRKRVAQTGPSQKKRKGARGRQITDAAPDSANQVPPVLWQSSKERIKQHFDGPRALTKDPKPFSLLGDWRTRFGLDGEQPKGKEADVAGAVPNAADEILKAVEMASAAPEEEDWEDEGESVQEEGDGLGDLIAGSGLDPQALMRALQENLAATGAAPAGLDQSTLLKYALRMLSGEGEADDIAGELAEDLFEQAEEDDPEGKNIAEWAAKQKDRPDNGDEEESGASLDGVSGPVRKSKTTLPPTPPTNEASGTEGKGKKKAVEVPAPTSVASGLRSRKRKAAEAVPDDEPPPRPKRATRSYAAPTASSKSKTAEVKGGKGKRG